MKYKPLITIMLLCISFQNCISQSLSDLNKSVVKVIYSCKDISKVKSGTGFVWKKSNLIVTALHLVSGNCQNGTIKIYIPNKNGSSFYDAKIIKVLKSSDLVLLEANIPVLKPLTTTSSALFLKQSVDVIGFPLGASSKRSIQLSIPFNESKKLSQNLPPSVLGELTKIGFNANIDVVHFQGSLLPGLSGAPIFNSKGEIIAIGNGGLNRGQVGISWGMPASKLIELENSTEAISSINDTFRKSSDVAFSAEVSLSMASLGEDFLQMELKTLQKDKFVLKGLTFYKVATKSYNDILKYTNDPNGISAIINYFPKAELMSSNYDIYRNFETSSTLVLPVGFQVLQQGQEIYIKTSVADINFNLNYYPLAKSFDITDELCSNVRMYRPADSTSFWVKQSNWSYQNAIVTSDGQYINREGYSKLTFSNNSNSAQQLAFQFTTLAKKNKDLFFVTLTDQQATTEYNQDFTTCIQNPYNEKCAEVFQRNKIFGQFVFCQYLFSFSI